MKSVFITSRSLCSMIHSFVLPSIVFVHRSESEQYHFPYS